MSSLQVDNIQTYNSNPPVIKNVSGTEVGTFCRAWVNFNGTGTVAIRQSFNVSSITDNGVGDYTVNFTTAMPDANYSAVVITSPATASTARLFSQVFTNGTGTSAVAPSSSAFRFAAFNNATSTNYDPDYACASVFR